jgi:MFS family permease
MAFQQADTMQISSSHSLPETQEGTQEKFTATTGSSDNDPQSQKEAPQDLAEDTSTPAKHGFGFYMIIFSLAVVVFFSAMDATIIVTAFPTISRELHGGDKYVWIANCFVLASTVVQPLVGQLANIFGRRNPMLISVSLFAIGSGVAGGATNIAMLIAGRTLMGLGSGGIMVLMELIICDLVSLRERGKYLGLILGGSGLGVPLGPVIGGALAQANWRWVFYINLPVCAVTLVLLIIFLRLKYTPEASWKLALARIDYFGSVLFITSITSILLGLILGGTVFPWSSWRVILPLVLGFVGWAFFHVFEYSSWCKEPIIPPHIFGNRTTTTALVLTFTSGMLLEWTTFFLPVYFMGVLTTSPLKAGVDVLPFTIFVVPCAMVSGVLITIYGTYRPIHSASFAIGAVAYGLLSLLDEQSSRAAWICFQLLIAASIGLHMMSTLPAVLAPLPESDVAAATGTFAFLRVFGWVWGISIPSIVFNGQFNKHLHEIDNVELRDTLANGASYGYASQGFLLGLSGTEREQTVKVYAQAMKTVWQVAAAFSAVAFLMVFLEKHVVLRTELNTEFGIEGKKKTEDVEGREIMAESEDKLERPVPVDMEKNEDEA